MEPRTLTRDTSHDHIDSHSIYIMVSSYLSPTDATEHRLLYRVDM